MKIQCPYPDCKHELEFDDAPGATYGTEPWTEDCVCEKARKLICQASILIDVQPGEETVIEDLLAEEIPVAEAPREIEEWPEEFENLDVTWDTYKKFVLFKTAEHYRCMEHWVRGLFTEAAELVAVVMKAKRNQEPINVAKLIDELGDVGFFAANICGFLNDDSTWIFDMKNDRPAEEEVDCLGAYAGRLFSVWFRSHRWIDEPDFEFRDFLRKIISTGNEILAKYNMDWQDAWERNMIKLNKRYKGSFTTQEVKNRDLEAEAAAVEKLDV